MDERDDKIENILKSENITKKKSGTTAMSIIGYTVAAGEALLSYYYAQKGLIPAAYIALGGFIVTVIATGYFTNRLRDLDLKEKLRELDLEERIKEE